MCIRDSCWLALYSQGNRPYWQAVRTIYKPTRKIQQVLRPVKDTMVPLLSGGIYTVTCSCGEVYIGTMKHSVCTHIGEHSCCCHFRQPEKSAVAEHGLCNDDHHTLFEETKMLSLETAYYPCLLYTSRCV